MVKRRRRAKVVAACRQVKHPCVDVQSSVFAMTAHRLATQEGLPPVEIKRRPNLHTAEAQTSYRGKPVLGVSDDIICQTDAVQAAVAAHEIGHLKLKHRDRAFLLILAGALLIVIPMVAAMVGNPMSHATNIALFVGGLVATTVGQQVSMRASRRHEDEADDFAALRGYPVTPELVDHLRTTDRRVRARVWQTHRLPEERYRRHQPPNSAGEVEQG